MIVACEINIIIWLSATMADEKISKNIDAYVSDPTAYYLGYSDADHKKPFAKYFDFHVDPISDEVQKGIVSSPWGSGLGKNSHFESQIILLY